MTDTVSGELRLHDAPMVYDRSDEPAPGARPELVWPSGTFHLTELPLVFPAAGGAS